jgi:hypothetical protein
MKAILEKYKEHIPIVVMAEMLAVMEERCEWKPHGQYGWIIVPPHKEGAARNRDDLKNRPYCAVCGKEIKVNEADI